MKQAFKFKTGLITSLALSFVMLVSVSTPAFALKATASGAGTTSAPKAGGTAATSAACTKVASLATSSQSALSSHDATMQTDFGKRLTNIATNEASVDQNVANDRAKHKADFQTKITSIESQAGLTPTQLAAVSVYQNNMEQAEANREAAVDGARTTYRSSLQAAVSGRQQALTNSVDAYQAGVAAALATASTNCGTSGAVDTLRQTVKTAHQTLDTSRKDDAIAAQIKQLAATRNAAIKAANAAFASSAATYTATLVATLKA